MSPAALAKCNASTVSPQAATAAIAHPKPSRPARLAAGSLGGPTENSCLFNAMIAPLLRLSLKGALWDQGEANANEPVQYICLLSNMVLDWRAQWNKQAATPFDPTFPFVYRQLHAYPSGGLLGTQKRWERERERGTFTERERERCVLRECERERREQAQAGYGCHFVDVFVSSVASLSSAQALCAWTWLACWQHPTRRFLPATISAA